MPQVPDCHKNVVNIELIPPKILVAVGSNLPFGEQPPSDNIKAALSAFTDSPLKVEQVSRFFATPSFPKGSGPDYVNAAAELCGELSVGEILALFHRIEADFERKRDQRWGQRTLDLDLIAVGETIAPDLETYQEWRDLPADDQIRRAPSELILPHPRLQDRAFVLVPLADVAPDWRHPVLDQTVTEMLAALPKQDVSEIHPI